MNEIAIFNYQGLDVRTVERQDGTWWVLKDVCNALSIVDHKSVTRRLDPDERGVCQILSPSGMQEMTIINEPGLYNVIMRSDKQDAKDFKRWVTHEVLPSLHRTGTYSMQPLQPMSPAELLAAQANLLVQMEKKVDAIEAHAQAIEEKTETRAQALEAKVDNAVKVFSRPAQDHWVGDMDEAVKELCRTYHLSIPATKGRMYDELERTANCSIGSRLTRLRQRKKKGGARSQDIKALNKLDAVAADKQLRTIYEGIVRRWQAEYYNQ